MNDRNGRTSSSLLPYHTTVAKCKDSLLSISAGRVMRGGARQWLSKKSASEGHESQTFQEIPVDIPLQDFECDFFFFLGGEGGGG